MPIAELKTVKKVSTQRGFEFVSYHEDGPEQCGISPACPGMIRSSMDEHCFRVTYHSGQLVVGQPDFCPAPKCHGLWGRRIANRVGMESHFFANAFEVNPINGKMCTTWSDAEDVVTIARLPAPTTRSGVQYHGTVADDAEIERKRILRYIRTLQRVDQILVHQLHNAYQERPGFVYCNIRSLPGTERVIVKVGPNEQHRAENGRIRAMWSRTSLLDFVLRYWTREGDRSVLLPSGERTYRFQNVSSTAVGTSWRSNPAFHLRVRYDAPRICMLRSRRGNLPNVEFVIEETLRSLGQYVFRYCVVLTTCLRPEKHLLSPRHKRSHSQDDLIEEQDTRRQDRI
ncbi:hypothetical protein B0H12DRAFT_1077451 [Mycena haematopus]|nr:hypothetical protein B0H12DRAFT_1077451 [Mycena haematopus]